MNELKNKKIVAYCRTACASQVNNNDRSNLEDQVLAALSYARKHRLTIDQFYADNGYSGMNLDRPGIKQLLKDCRAGKIQGIIMRDQTRIARHHTLCLKVRCKLKNAGIKLFFMSGESEESDKFQLTVLNAVQELI